MLFMVMNSRGFVREEEEEGGKEGQEVRRKLEGQERRKSFQNRDDSRWGDRMIRKDKEKKQRI